MSEEKYRVLIVEDDPELLPMISDVLSEEERFEVQREDNGFHAALKISSWLPHVILLDYVIPGINGFELCRKIRQDPRTKHIPVLAISSLATAENRKAIRESGITDYLPKPFSSTDLMDRVWKLLENKTHSDLKT